MNLQNGAGGDPRREHGIDTGAARRWLRVGAVAAGIGAAMIGTSGVAAASPEGTGSESRSAERTSQHRGDTPSAGVDKRRSARKGGRNEPARHTRAGAGQERSQASSSTGGSKERLATGIVVRRDHADQGRAKRGTKAETDTANEAGRSHQDTHAPRRLSAVPHTVADGSAHTAVAERPANTAVATQPVAAADAGSSVVAAVVVRPTYPQAVTARPVTTRSILNDVLDWAGLGSLSSQAPLPAVPVGDFLAGVWIGIRKVHYTVANRYGTVSEVTVDEQDADGVVRGVLNGEDPDGDVVDYELVTGPQNGSVQLDADGSFVYTPTESFAHQGGTDSFTVSVSDQNAANPWHTNILANLLGQRPKSYTVTVSVDPVNRAPAIVATPGTPDEDSGAVIIDVHASDGDHDPVVVTVKNPPQYGEIIDNGDGTWTYRPSDDARHAVLTDPDTAPSGEDIVFVATDDRQAQVEYTVRVTIGGHNEPIVNHQPTVPVETDETGSAGGAVDVVDPDGDSLSHDVDNGPSYGQVTVDEDGNFTYVADDGVQHQAAVHNAANPGEPFTDTFTIRSQDEYGDATVTTVSVVIAPANEAPVYTGDTTVNIDNGYESVVKLAGNDSDGDPLTFEIVSIPEGLEVAITENNILTVSGNWVRPFDEYIVVRMTDAAGASVLQSLIMDIRIVGDPIIVEAPEVVNEPGRIPLSYVSPDGVTTTGGTLVFGGDTPQQNSFYINVNHDDGTADVIRKTVDGHEIVILTVPEDQAWQIVLKSSDEDKVVLYAGSTLVDVFDLS